MKLYISRDLEAQADPVVLQRLIDQWKRDVSRRALTKGENDGRD